MVVNITARTQQDLERLTWRNANRFISCQKSESSSANSKSAKRSKIREIGLFIWHKELSNAIVRILLVVVNLSALSVLVVTGYVPPSKYAVEVMTNDKQEQSNKHATTEHSANDVHAKTVAIIDDLPDKLVVPPHPMQPEEADIICDWMRDFIMACPSPPSAKSRPSHSDHDCSGILSLIGQAEKQNNTKPEHSNHSLSSQTSWTEIDKVPTPKPVDLILPHQQHPPGKEDARKGEKWYRPFQRELTAGLMPFNPAAEWLPTAPSTLSLSGQPEGRGSCSLHAIFASSFDREGANLIANSLFDVSTSVLLDRIVKGLKVKTKLEQTRECTDFQSKESSHAMKMEELIEHDSAFNGSPLHRSSLPDIFNVWRECFAHDFNYILPIPDIQMESLSTLQWILFFDALLLKTTDQLVTTAINKVRLLGQHASIVELNSLTLAHPANDRIYHTLFFPIVFVHSEPLPPHATFAAFTSKIILRESKKSTRRAVEEPSDGCERCRSEDTGCSLASSLSIHSDDNQTGDHLPNNDAVVPHDDPLHRPEGDEDEGRLSLRSTHPPSSRYTSCEHHVASGHCAETEESHHLQQLALLRTRNAARPRTHSNQRTFAIRCNDRTDFTFNMNAMYLPFVLARLWKESALIIISTCLTEIAPLRFDITHRPERVSAADDAHPETLQCGQSSRLDKLGTRQGSCEIGVSVDVGSQTRLVASQPDQPATSIGRKFTKIHPFGCNINRDASNQR
ncbi:hypothetical protein BLNAU_20613 [Blattamonas nauphoetae]|uniref:Uncharacterized protein n=1 Tax=Blattamonas nauphoetae TaxID=2049346 RepID=A0ABQ9WY66_9EUKA|nr:hypothetical protein BLNAU_20613 [Blattamonas nauphoetae]